MPAQENNQSKNSTRFITNNIHIEENCPTVADIFASPIAKFITISASSFV